jgi:hypothetical protein
MHVDIQLKWNLQQLQGKNQELKFRTFKLGIWPDAMEQQSTHPGTHKC